MQLRSEQNGAYFIKRESVLRLFSEKIHTLLLDKNKQPAHLTSEQRYTIAQMKTNGFSNKAICQTIGKAKSVLSRELRRNTKGWQRSPKSGILCRQSAKGWKPI
jgi:DNA-binding NarL/FixJ family response regulator